MSFVSDMPRPGATKADAILEVHALRKAFGPVVAVEDVQFTLGRGEFVTFLGPSGSGKTTTLEMIAGLTRPTSGRIFLNGKPIDPLPPYRRDIGVVFQHYALFPHMTLSRNIAFPLEMRRVPRAEVRRRVGEALELVGLAGYADRLPRELSGGQQQRVALARALVFRPPLLLMDEPLGALDKKLREQMQLEIKQIHRGLDASIVYVTHDQDEALVMSDRIAVFNGGRIEQIGPPEELYDRPKTRFVAGFLGEFELLRRQGRERRGRTMRNRHRRRHAARGQPCRAGCGRWRVPRRTAGARAPSRGRRTARRRQCGGGDRHRRHLSWAVAEISGSDFGRCRAVRVAAGPGLRASPA